MKCKIFKFLLFSLVLFSFILLLSINTQNSKAVNYSTHNLKCIYESGSSGDFQSSLAAELMNNKSKYDLSSLRVEFCGKRCENDDVSVNIDYKQVAEIGSRFFESNTKNPTGKIKIILDTKSNNLTQNNKVIKTIYDEKSLFSKEYMYANYQMLDYSDWFEITPDTVQEGMHSYEIRYKQNSQVLGHISILGLTKEQIDSVNQNTKTEYQIHPEADCIELSERGKTQKINYTITRSYGTYTEECDLNTLPRNS